MSTEPNPFDAAEFAPNPIKRWEVTNRVTGKTTSYKSSKAATKAQDRMDWAYGACCTTRRAIYA